MPGVKTPAMPIIPVLTNVRVPVDDEVKLL